MNLPNDYFWIPGFENRYAMKLNDAKVVKSGGPALRDTVYSVVYPGHKGTPWPLTSIWTSNGYNVALTPPNRHYKDTYSVKSLQKKILDSNEYKRMLQSQKHESEIASCCGGCHSKAYSSTVAGEAGWIIGRYVNGVLSFSSNPKIHTTEKSAFAECERLATSQQGTAYVVLKTVRQVVAGGLIVTTM